VGSEAGEFLAADFFAATIDRSAQNVRRSLLAAFAAKLVVNEIIDSRPILVRVVKLSAESFVGHDFSY
jgi:hypothetical protein